MTNKRHNLAVYARARDESGNLREVSKERMDNIIFYLKEHWTLNNTKFNPKINVNGSEKVVPWSWHRPILDFINFVSFNPVVYQVWHYDFEKNIAGYEYKSAQREGNAYVTHYPW